MPLQNPSEKEDRAARIPPEFIWPGISNGWRWRPGAEPSIWEQMDEHLAKRIEERQTLRPRQRQGVSDMPLQDPAISVKSYHFADGEKYLLKLTDIVDAPPSTKNPDWKPQVKFIFAAHDMDRKPILDDDGEQAYISRYGSQSTGVKTKITRPYLEILIGREITNEDTGAGLVAEALGKWAIGLIVDNDNGYSEIAKLSPMRKTAAKPKDDEDDD